MKKSLPFLILIPILLLASCSPEKKYDKKIVLDLLEKTVIADKGGVGRYPGSRSVHMDVRGWGARWDKQ